MAMRPKLELRQTQQLTMTPQLRQAITMLAMSATQLEAFLAAEVEKNPLLSLDDGSRLAAAPPAEPAVATVDAAMRKGDLAAGEAQFDGSRDNLYEGAEPAVGRGGGRDFETLDDDGAGALADRPSLAAHVAAQVALMRLDPAERLVAEALAGDLDDAGYLRIDFAEAAARLGVAARVVERAAAALRACEPTGVGARDLAECLGLQLAEQGALDAPMRALLAHLPDLPTTPAAVMAARCGVSVDGLSAMLARLRRLDPRPGLAFAAPPLAPAAPDVLVRPDPEGGWRVALNPAATPRVLIDRRYAARVGGGCPRTRRYLADCAQTAGWLARSLDQRARTILKVAAEVVRVQEAFFERGVSGLKPLTLKAVAEAVDVHESTVSRVTAHKTVATPRGVFEMRFFFGASLASADGGEARAAEAVRERIRALIGAEAPGRPLSDDGIVRLLKAEGVDVARRTVTKYREALRIPSSVERRRRAAAAV
ncbi:MAG: RNA polymerase sigma-54 factor [Rhodobacteraceae bacterium]|nr:MAG: RNA polymerase sigma-54 factor [Paracoccaceae bacterium]